MVDYSAKVSKIESDYGIAYNDYLKKLSDYESRKLKHNEGYEKTYNDIAYKNAEVRRNYLEEKANVEAENKKLKEEYEKEVADIKAANERAQKEYEEELAKWKAEKIKVENTVKTKDLIDSVLMNKIDELKKKGVNITVGRDEVTEVDGTTGKISEDEARAKLGELSKVKLTELDKAEKAKISGDATNKEYSDRVNIVKGEIAGLSNIKVTYTNGGVVGNVSSDITELNKKLEQAKALNKLVGKVNELNSKISEHDKGIVGKLKAAGVSDAEGVYNKKTIVPASGFNAELETLKKKEGLTDGEIDAFISRVSNRLDTAKATVDKAIKASKSGGTGEALDDAEYDKKWAEFQEKIKEYNSKGEAEGSLHTSFESDFAKVFGIKYSALKNKANMKIVSHTGNITYYKGKDTYPGDSPRNFWSQTGSPGNVQWEESSEPSLGINGVQYMRVKLAKGASVTYDLEFNDEDSLKNSDDRLTLTYRLVNGEKVPKTIKKIRCIVINNGSLYPTGETVFYLINNPATPLVAVFATNVHSDKVISKDKLLDISNLYMKPVVEYKYSYKLLDSENNELSLGFKQLNNDGSFKGVVQSKPIDNVAFLYGNNAALTNDGNDDTAHKYTKVSYTKPDTWDNDFIEKQEQTFREYISESSYSYEVGSREFRDKQYYEDTRIVGNRVKMKSSSFTFGRDIVPGDVEKPTFNYTRKNTPVEVLETLANSSSLDIPVKTPTPSSFTTINPVKVLYKYKETFKEKEPGTPPVKPVPGETMVHYKPLPKEPIPTKQPNKTPLPEIPSTPPTKPTNPLPPMPPTEPKITTKPNTPTLNLPPLPTKPWEPDSPIYPKLSKTLNLTLTLNEYVLKEPKISHANSLAIKHKLASFANSFQLRKL